MKTVYLKSLFWLLVSLGIVPFILLLWFYFNPGENPLEYEFSELIEKSVHPEVFLLIFLAGCIIAFKTGTYKQIALLFPSLLIAFSPLLFLQTEQSQLNDLETQLSNMQSEIVALKSDLNDSGPYILSVVLEDANENISKVIDMTLFEKFCGDVTGCTVTLKMENYSQSTTQLKEVASFGPLQLFFDKTTLRWRVAHFATNYKLGAKKEDQPYNFLYGPDRGGTLSDGSNRNHLVRAWGCFLTEQAYNAESELDVSPDIFLHAAGKKGRARYPYKGKICTLIIRD